MKTKKIPLYFFLCIISFRIGWIYGEAYGRMVAGVDLSVDISDMPVRSDEGQIATQHSNTAPLPPPDALPDTDRLADAIYRAEGGEKTRYPYGILQKYKVTTPRQACINTIKSAQKRFAKQKKETDFVHFLSLTYCPIGAKNDPGGLNKYWVKNVKYFYLKGSE